MFWCVVDASGSMGVYAKFFVVRQIVRNITYSCKASVPILHGVPPMTVMRWDKDVYEMKAEHKKLPPCGKSSLTALRNAVYEAYENIKADTAANKEGFRILILSDGLYDQSDTDTKAVKELQAISKTDKLKIAVMAIGPDHDALSLAKLSSDGKVYHPYETEEVLQSLFGLSPCGRKQRLDDLLAPMFIAPAEATQGDEDDWE